MMDWSVVGLNLLYAVLGVVLMYLAYRIIDLLTPEVHFAEELKKGNLAVGMFVSAIFIAVAIVVAGALN
jgi:putative membrane protein